MIIHTVYKSEENLDYFDDWFRHHTLLGVEHFYMYDNSGGYTNQWWNDPSIIDCTPDVNRHGFKHKYDVAYASEKQFEIFEKYPVTHIEWKPRDSSGNIIYHQPHAIFDFSTRVKSGLCAFIDIDEFIIKQEDFYPCYMEQRRFKSRHFYESVHDCHEYLDIGFQKTEGTKCIIDMSDFPKFDPDNKDHSIHFSMLKDQLSFSKNYFNHYNYNKVAYRKSIKNNTYGHIYRKLKPYPNCFSYIDNTGLLK